MKFAILKSKKNIAFLVTFSLGIALLASGEKVKSDIADLTLKFFYSPFFEINKRAQVFYEVHQKNKSQEEEIIRLILENNYLKELGLENQRLRELLGFKTQTRYQVIAAEVVGSDPQRKTSSVIINVGSLAGAKRNMSVVNVDGLVGKVIEVFPTTSVVQLLFDPNGQVSALDQRSREQGIIRWEKGWELNLEYVPSTADIIPGDEIVTSGQGGIFPAGLKIGVVTKVDKQSNLLFQNIKVRPYVKINSLEEVFVVEQERVL